MKTKLGLKFDLVLIGRQINVALIQILVPNFLLNFGQKSKFCSKILVKNLNVGQKSKFWSKNLV